MLAGQSNVEIARLRALKLLRKNRETRLPSYEFTRELALVFRDYVNLSKCKDIQELLTLIRNEGDYLLSLYPTEFILRNILGIITKFIREEAQKLVFGEDPEPFEIDTLMGLWKDPKDPNLKVDMKQLKKAVMGSIEEHTLVLDSSSEEMAGRALDHVTGSDKVMTFHYSDSATLQSFLKSTKCQILSLDDVECKEPKKLPYNAIPLADVVIKIRDASKVVLSAVAVLPDGSCVMQAGTRIICELAKEYSLPVIVCSALYKFTPIFLPNLYEYNRHGAAGKLLGDDSELLSEPNLRITNPIFDHIPAKFVKLYVTQDSSISSSHVKEILSENYHPHDLYSFNKN